MLKVLLQDSWDEPDDEELIVYLKQINADVTLVSEQDIKLYKSEDFDIVFLDTDLVHLMLGSVEVVPTYPECFKSLYYRNIEKKTIANCIKSTKSIFVKPLNNDKSFESIIFDPTDKWDVAYLLEQEESSSSYVYCCDVVEFVNEFRLYVLNNKLHGIQESSDYIIDIEKIIRSTPPQEFLDRVLVSNIYPVCVIDIGMMKNGQFCVVEVNPPFSISSYDYPIEKYVDFCHEAWKILKVSRI
jgi:hypothetical protein